MEKFDNIQFARKWFSETKTRFPDDADPVLQELMRFFAAYVAFNALYATFKRDDGVSDRSAIRQFLERTQRHFGNYSLKSAYQRMDWEHREIKEPVSIFDIHDSIFMDCYCEDIPDNTLRVFQRIHTIRCNLFHGMKDPYNPDEKRDLWLIMEGRTILEDFLEWYFGNLDRAAREKATSRP